MNLVGSRFQPVATRFEVAGGVLVSRTVRDLVAGPGLRFETTGSHRLKGVPEEWQLYGVM